eukprot:UN31576
MVTIITKVEVKGREGFNSSRLNGKYSLRKEKIGERPSYAKDGNDTNKMIIWYWKDKRVWMMTRHSMIGTDSAYACVKQDVQNPTQVTVPWKVFDKQEESHVPDEKMKIVVIEKEQMNNNKKDNPPSENTTILKSKIIELTKQIENMKKTIDDLEDKVVANDAELERLELQREDRLTVGESLEAKFNILGQQQFSKDEKIKNMFQQYKQVNQKNKDLRTENTVNKDYEQIQSILKPINHC